MNCESQNLKLAIKDSPPSKHLAFIARIGAIRPLEVRGASFRPLSE